MMRRYLGVRKKSAGEDDRRQSLSSFSEDGNGSTSLPPLSQIATSTSLQLRKGGEPDPGPLGLNVVYTPENGHKADIIFIHGLGGTSRLTWSKYKNPELFWPLTFLPLEPDVCLARILTFGYDADFRRAGNASTSILDFSKTLLSDLKYATDEHSQHLNVGTVPLIFVVHSMGGLIVKEAYMQGQNDPEVADIIKAISAIIFLATPHRGTNLADILNRILQSTFVTNSKQYISELARNSFTLQKLNEQFRHIAPRLDIVSFYETQPTPIIGRTNARIMVLEKDSSVLGYPGETSQALNADHHGVCKYDSPRDPNYVTVRNVLKSLVSKIISTSRSNRQPLTDRRESMDLKSLLGITELPDIDYIFFRDQWTPGTSDWILDNKDYLEWVRPDESKSQLLWLNGGGGTGKSVLSSFIINSLVEQGACCQYFFIRFGDQKKRKLSLLLRSIAYQMAQSVQGFAQKVLELGDEAIDFEAADPRVIWERIFKSVLFKMEIQQELYWIIDGIDEAADPRAVIRLLSDVALSSIPIRILLVGRKTSDIALAFQVVPEVLNLGLISIEGHMEDLRCYIRKELVPFRTSAFRESVVQRVVEGAQDNFLWVRLVVHRLNKCRTEDEVDNVLQGLPVGMEALYDRMTLSITQNPSPTDRELASNILQCVTCSLRVLTVAELSQALNEDTTKMLDFDRTVADVCGGFVVIDNGGNVAMIHQTAREYLLSGTDRSFYVDRNAAHTHMFLSCIRCLMAPGIRGKINRYQKSDFLDYAASSWSAHLTSSIPDSEQVASELHRFLTGQWVLTWIQILATLKRLRVLIQASNHLSKYEARQREYNAAWHAKDNELVDSWAIDLVKILGKFGRILQRNAESIYKLIPPFCPRNSAIYLQFGKGTAPNLMVSGLSNENWDDSLARLSFGFGTSASFASSIAAAGAQIAVLATSGDVFLYDSAIFEEASASPIKHGEHLYRMQLNSAGTLLATYGYRTTKVWEISTGKCKVSVDNVTSRPRPLTMLFTDSNSTLLVGTDDRRLRSLDLNDSSPTWKLVAELDELELEGHFLNSSSYMALNKEGSLIAVAYRGHPLSAWEIDGPVHIGHCWRTRDQVARGEVIDAVWHPHFPEVLGLYLEGIVFKWRPYDDECEEIATGASKIAMSADGSLFAAGDVHGTVKIYTTSDVCLLYQLASEDTVLGLAFSPDLRRFYDIRGYYGNAWEPNILMKYAGQMGKGTETESETESLRHGSMTSSSVHRIDSITTFAGSPVGRLYCCGTEKGILRLHDAKRGKITDVHVSRSFLSIEKISWSSDGRYVCFSDSSKTVFVMSVAPPSASHADPVVGNKTEIHMANLTKGPILQLLFKPDSRHVLVYSSSRICTISLASSMTHAVDWHMPACEWIVHPQNPGQIIGVGPASMHILDWKLYVHRTCEYANPPPNEPLSNDSNRFSDQDIVDRVLVAPDKKHVLVQISLLSRNSKDKVFLHFKTSSLSLPTATILDTDKETDTVTVTPVMLPLDISHQITATLSLISQDRLIFLSRDFSICSWQIPPRLESAVSPHLPGTNITSGASTKSDTTTLHHHQHNKNHNTRVVKELFSLPGDWISRDCLALCSIWGVERSLLCPRNGEVAVVRCTTLF